MHRYIAFVLYLWYYKQALLEDLKMSKQTSNKSSKSY